MPIYKGTVADLCFPCKVNVKKYRLDVTERTKKWKLMKTVLNHTLSREPTASFEYEKKLYLYNETNSSYIMHSQEIFISDFSLIFSREVYDYEVIYFVKHILCDEKFRVSYYIFLLTIFLKLYDHTFSIHWSYLYLTYFL